MLFVIQRARRRAWAARATICTWRRRLKKFTGARAGLAFFSFGRRRLNHSRDVGASAHAPRDEAPEEVEGDAEEDRQRYHRQNDADEDERDGGGDVNALAEGLCGAAEEARGADERRRRLQGDADCGEARLVFEEARAFLYLLYFGADVRKLALDRNRVRHPARALHDVEQLRFECPLRSQARVEVNVLFGHVLPRDLLRGDAARGGAYVTHRRVELRGGHAHLHRDDLERLAPARARLLPRLGRDDEAAARLSDRGDALHGLLRLFDFERDAGVAYDLALDRDGRALRGVGLLERDVLHGGLPLGDLRRSARLVLGGGASRNVGVSHAR